MKEITKNADRAFSYFLFQCHRALFLRTIPQKDLPRIKFTQPWCSIGVLLCHQNCSLEKRERRIWNQLIRETNFPGPAGHEEKPPSLNIMLVHPLKLFHVQIHDTFKIAGTRNFNSPCLMSVKTFAHPCGSDPTLELKREEIGMSTAIVPRLSFHFLSVHPFRERRHFERQTCSFLSESAFIYQIRILSSV